MTAIPYTKPVPYLNDRKVEPASNLKKGFLNRIQLGHCNLKTVQLTLEIDNSNSISTCHQLQNEDSHYTSPNSINEVLSSRRCVLKSKSLSNQISPSNWR